MNVRDELTQKILRMPIAQMVRDMPEENIPEFRILFEQFEREIQRLSRKRRTSGDD